jgi:hypothetical protein
LPGIRKSSVLGLILVATVAFSLNRATGAPAIQHKQNPIALENARRGTTAWSNFPAATQRSIEGYTSQLSSLPGGVLSFHVSTKPRARYRILVYRLGWYRGRGARLIGCLPACSGSLRGTPRPVPPPQTGTGEIRAGWPAAAALRIGRSWVSGCFIAKLVLLSGPQVHHAATTAFIVRSSSTSRSPLLVQVPVNTWEAYNNWGGKSLYGYNSTGNIAAVKVSFNRPFADQGDLFRYEYQLIRFLERQRYDVSYVTDLDIDRHPRDLLSHKLVLTAGHSEYWSKTNRDAFEFAQQRGINLAFLGADIGQWQIRYENSHRTIVEYRNATLDPESNPLLKTTEFRKLQPPRPECSLRGVQYQGGLDSPSVLSRDYRINAAALSDSWFIGTGFTSSSTLPKLVGYEWDATQAGCVSPTLLTTFFHYSGVNGTGKPAPADAVRYSPPTGGNVFSSGSMRFAWALDSWGTGLASAIPAAQQFMRNLIASLGR